MLWSDILQLWALVEADLQDRGIDLDQPGIRRGRTWRWLRIRIEGLLSAPPQLLIDREGRVHRVPQTRLGLALDPPDPRPRPGAHHDTEDTD